MALVGVRVLFQLDGVFSVHNFNLHEINAATNETIAKTPIEKNPDAVRKAGTGIIISPNIKTNAKPPAPKYISETVMVSPDYKIPWF